MRISSTLRAFISIYCFCYLITAAEAEEKNIKLRLYRKSNSVYEQAALSEGETLFVESKGYNQTLPVVLLIHGMATGADCYFINGLIEAFSKRQLTEDYNIFAVDMPELFENSFRNEFYIGVLANVEPAGLAIGEFLSKVVNLKLTAPERIHIIGYSIGAQVAGYAARVVKNSFGEVNFIAGLDPAGPGFHTSWGGRPTLIHVSAADARVTHFYHTNSISCGTRDRVATADFVFNRGTVQPGCTKDKGLQCSHVRVPNLYIEAVSNPKSFAARKCSNWEKFKTCSCNHHETTSISFPPDLSAKGVYYLRTRAKSPFALGRKGSRCGKLVHGSNGKHNRGHTTLTSKLKDIKDSLHPTLKIKDSINMHLINGIRKMEDLRNPEVYKQLKTSNGENAENQSIERGAETLSGEKVERDTLLGVKQGVKPAIESNP